MMGRISMLYIIHIRRRVDGVEPTVSGAEVACARLWTYHHLCSYVHAHVKSSAKSRVGVVKTKRGSVYGVAHTISAPHIPGLFHNCR